MRRFLLERVEDSSGVSGTGWVAEGIQFTNGIVALTWRVLNGEPVAIGDWSSTAVYPHLSRCQEVHGHAGKTVFRFIDETDPPHELWCPAIIAGGCGCQCGLGLKETGRGESCASNVVGRE